MAREEFQGVCGGLLVLRLPAEGRSPKQVAGSEGEGEDAGLDVEGRNGRGGHGAHDDTQALVLYLVEEKLLFFTSRVVQSGSVVHLRPDRRDVEGAEERGGSSPAGFRDGAEEGKACLGLGLQDPDVLLPAWGSIEVEAKTSGGVGIAHGSPVQGEGGDGGGELSTGEDYCNRFFW